MERGIWTTAGGTVNGYVKGAVTPEGDRITDFSNLMQISIPDAGHLVPNARPVVSRRMLYRWIFSEGFPVKFPLAGLAKQYGASAEV